MRRNPLGYTKKTKKWGPRQAGKGKALRLQKKPVAAGANRPESGLALNQEPRTF